MLAAPELLRSSTAPAVTCTPSNRNQLRFCFQLRCGTSLGSFESSVHFAPLGSCKCLCSHFGSLSPFHLPPSRRYFPHGGLSVPPIQKADTLKEVFRADDSCSDRVHLYGSSPMGGHELPHSNAPPVFPSFFCAFPVHHHSSTEIMSDSAPDDCGISFSSIQKVVPSWRDSSFSASASHPEGHGRPSRRSFMHSPLACISRSPLWAIADGGRELL